jgi:hypothetical protein
VPYRRAEGVLSETADGRAMLATPSGQEVIVLNSTGTIVWELLTDHGDAASLARGVQERYPDLLPETVERDVQAFLGELLEASLVEET